MTAQRSAPEQAPLSIIHEQAPLPRVLSFGAGVQSHALLALLGQGRYPGAAPDEVWFCDPGDERPETYSYMERVTLPYCTAHGITFLRLEKHSRIAGETLLESYRRRQQYPLRQNRQCTVDWKIKVMEAECKRRGWHKTGGVEKHIGISMDEIHRATSAGAESWEVKRYPLIEARMYRDTCAALCVQEFGAVPVKSGCWFCFAGETEVITSQGQRPIRDLAAEGHATLLVPRERSGWADWRTVEIREMGIQPLLKLTLTRGRAVKEVYATAEHRWIVKDRAGCWQRWISTGNLQPGDVLPSSRLSSITASRHAAHPSPFGVAAGFVYGDGWLERETQPATVILHGDKDKALLPYFAACAPRETVLPSGKMGIYISNLPRQWKEPPPFSESRAYLLGWLAGYFAADGTVSVKGQAVLHSAKMENVQLVRNVCDLLGVQTSPIRTDDREGFNGVEPLHSVGIRGRDLPESFWLLDAHRERALSAQDKEERARMEWVVLHVTKTDRVEPVYCAIVPGDEMFVLADNLVTGNCKYQRRQQWREVWEQRADGRWNRAVDWEREVMAKHGTAGAFIYHSKRAVDRTLPQWAAMWEQGEQLALPDLEPEGACDGGYCMV